MVTVQPVTGLWLARIAGYPLTTGWLAAAVVLYLFVDACWRPVVGIQIEMRRIVDRLSDGDGLPARGSGVPVTVRFGAETPSIDMAGSAICVIRYTAVLHATVIACSRDGRSACCRVRRVLTASCRLRNIDHRLISRLEPVRNLMNRRLMLAIARGSANVDKWLWSDEVCDDAEMVTAAGCPCYPAD